MIEIKSLSYSYNKKDKILDDLSISISEGQFFGVLGKNGSGKSTLLNIMAGIRTQDSGILNIDKNEIAFLSHDVELKKEISVSDFLTFHSMFFERYSAELETDLLNYFKINKESVIDSLSTGQKKIVLAIACLSSRTKILLVDEITAVLDPEARFKLFKKLKEFNEQYQLTIVLATNIAEDLIDRVDNVLYLKDKMSTIVEPSSIKEMFNYAE